MLKTIKEITRIKQAHFHQVNSLHILNLEVLLTLFNKARYQMRIFIL